MFGKFSSGSGNFSDVLVVGERRFDVLGVGKGFFVYIRVWKIVRDDSGIRVGKVCK